MSWTDEYPSTTFRGPARYPIPEDWVLNNVEMEPRWEPTEFSGGTNESE